VAITTDSTAECPGENYRILCSPPSPRISSGKCSVIVNHESSKSKEQIYMVKKRGSCISALLPQLLPPQCWLLASSTVLR
jgi:hypothetical protein